MCQLKIFKKLSSPIFLGKFICRIALQSVEKYKEKTNNVELLTQHSFRKTLE